MQQVQTSSIKGFTTVVDSTWKSFSGTVYYVESKFGTSTLTSAQRLARYAPGVDYRLQRWSYSWASRVGAYLGFGVGLGFSK